MQRYLAYILAAICLVAFVGAGPPRTTRQSGAKAISGGPLHGLDSDMFDQATQAKSIMRTTCESFDAQLADSIYPYTVPTNHSNSGVTLTAVGVQTGGYVRQTGGSVAGIFAGDADEGGAGVIPVADSGVNIQFSGQPSGLGPGHRTLRGTSGTFYNYFGAGVGYSDNDTVQFAGCATYQRQAGAAWDSSFLIGLNGSDASLHNPGGNIVNTSWNVEGGVIGQIDRSGILHGYSRGNGASVNEMGSVDISDLLDTGTATVCIGFEYHITVAATPTGWIDFYYKAVGAGVNADTEPWQQFARDTCNANDCPNNGLVQSGYLLPTVEIKSGTGGAQSQYTWYLDWMCQGQVHELSAG